MKNKKLLVIVLAAVLVLAVVLAVVLIGGKKEYKLGMGVAFGDMTNAQINATVATVVLNQAGEIVACRIDAIQNKVNYADGVYAIADEYKTKAELKEGYNMAAWGTSLVGNPTVKEWYLQAQAFEAYVVGMTAAEVEAMPLQTMSNGYQISADEALLATGCTIQITDFKAAVVKACKDGQEHLCHRP